MKKMMLAWVVASGIGASALAQEAPPAAKLDIKVEGIENGKPIADKFAYCVPDGKGRTQNGGNINPAISWSAEPSGTKSYAVIVVDPDVPASFELANQPDKIIPADFPRQNFYHWVLVDIPATMNNLPEGKDSKGVTQGGKPVGKTDYGMSGQNNYPGGGYDGPCPPWNDERMHHYHFMVYALDVETLGLTGKITGQQAMNAIATHTLAKGEVIGTFTNNPKLLAK